jgi:hypothetical protein
LTAPATPSYDCFISYRAARFDWVETLARNLVDQGLAVFLDRWGLIPGDDFPGQLDRALGASRAGLLVATPDTVDSEWVRNEWNRMLSRRSTERRDLALAEHPNGASRPFPILPLLLGPMPALPFAGNYHAIDFSRVTDETGYRRAFATLIKALAGEPPGPDPRYDGPLLLPPDLARQRAVAPSQRGALDEALLLLRRPQPVAILAQAHYPLGRLADALAEGLGGELGPDRVVRLAPLNDAGSDAATYFAHLAGQAGLDAGIDCAGALRHALEARFGDQDWTLVVRDFDQGPDQARRALAGELRALADAGRARIAILGGVHLAEQIYSNPIHSLLRGAEVVMLDAPSDQDLAHWHRELFPDQPPDPDTLAAIAAAGGGHPRLIQQALLAQGLGRDWRTALADTRPYEPLLTPYYPDREAICALLDQGIPGLAQTWDPDPLVRRLYWDNLLTRGDERYVWRCAALKAAARRLLGCS